MLTTITSFHTFSVKMPNNQSDMVTYASILHLSPSFLLTDVLIVPAFSFNLIYVSSLIKNISCCLILLRQYMFIQDLRTWTTIGVAKESSGIYFFTSNFSTIFKAPCNSISSNILTALWHCISDL